MRYAAKFILIALSMAFAAQAQAQIPPAECPGEDPEPALSVKTKEGPTLFLCGFQDDAVNSKDKRAFSDFTVYYSTEKAPSPQKVFASDPNETFWAKVIPGKTIQLEELWFFGEKPQAALRSEINCTADACKMSDTKCILKMKSNPFPKALAEFKKKAAANDLKEDGEDLIDQIFAQAFNGDKAAKQFYANPPTGLDPELQVALSANRKKLDAGCKR